MVFRRLLGSKQSAPVETGDAKGLHQSAPVDTSDSTDLHRVDTGSALLGTDVSADLHRSASVDTGATRSANPPITFGALRSPQEHAAKLVESLREMGSEVYGRSFYQGELASFLSDLCEELGWIRRKWPAVGRELIKLPGVRKGKVWFNGQRLTVYEIGPVPTEAIVDLAEEKLRKRA